MMIRRNVAQRVQALADFISWDPDPYLIIDKQGQVRYAYVGKTIADRPTVNDLLQEAAKYVK